MKDYPLTIPVCQLDEDGYFVGMTTADLDPVVKNGHYLIPRLCIESDEPEHKNGFIPQWNDGQWKYIEDHRGEVVYLKKTGEKQTITAIGKLSKDVTTCAPLPFTEWSEEAGAWVDVANADELRLQDKKEKAGVITRSQLLTAIELQYGKNKDDLLEIAERELTGERLIKIRAAILEAQFFRLDNEDLWLFFTETLSIEPDKLFELWETAEKQI
ncbi:hypothetical protein [Snodgrassella alvi]|uniref:hypothetical protein n=1 Tax=Snodgrassella alvi TaxID=1196083 RepID=UPI0035141DC9